MVGHYIRSFCRGVLLSVETVGTVNRIVNLLLLPLMHLSLINTQTRPPLTSGIRRGHRT